jgi:tripartite-type tricarboxylate transporter receptor subunit TctC
MLPSLLAALLAATLTSPLCAQQWPTRTIRIVTGTPAGGSPDFVSRLLGEKLAERLGQAVVVENSASTGMAAWNTVAKSQPDGYLISMLTGAFSARAAVAKSLPYDPIRDFTFITLVSGYPMVVATAASSPIKSFTDLIARAKAAPYSVTYGMNLPGSVHHLTGELSMSKPASRCAASPTGEIPRSCRTCWAAGSMSWSRPEPSRSPRSRADRYAASRSRPASASRWSQKFQPSAKRCPASR